MWCEYSTNGWMLSGISSEGAEFAVPRRARLRLTQTRPVFRRLGLSIKQSAQLTLLLGNKHADHLPAHLGHAHPTKVSNTFQPEQH